MWWPANLLAVSRIQLLVNRESKSFWREDKMMIPNGLTRDDPSSMPQFLPLVSKPISNQYLTIIRWILYEYQLVIGGYHFAHRVKVGLISCWAHIGQLLDIGLVSRAMLYHHLVNIACILSARCCKQHLTEWYNAMPQKFSIQQNV